MVGGFEPLTFVEAKWDTMLQEEDRGGLAGSLARCFFPFRTTHTAHTCSWLNVGGILPSLTITDIQAFAACDTAPDEDIGLCRCLKPSERLN